MTLSHQSQTNRLLGYPDEARLLILNADDLGMCQSINEAIFRTLREGVVRSTSLMVPWPAARDAMTLLQEHPELDFGVHLTIICDSPDYRWGPVTSGERVRSLIDENGNFYHVDQESAFLAQARLDEAEIEFRAQIDAALAAGLKPTHLDWHCLLDGGRADIFDLTLALAKEYGLALRVTLRSSAEGVERQDLPANDHDVLDSYSLDVVTKPARYAQMLRELPAGLTEWAVHPGLGKADLQTLEPDSWQVRQTDFDYMMSAEARDIIRQEGIILIGYRPLQALWQEG